MNSTRPLLTLGTLGTCPGFVVIDEITIDGMRFNLPSIAVNLGQRLILEPTGYGRFTVRLQDVESES